MSHNDTSLGWHLTTNRQERSVCILPIAPHFALLAALKTSAFGTAEGAACDLSPQLPPPSFRCHEAMLRETLLATDTSCRPPSTEVVRPSSSPVRDQLR